MVYSSGSQPFLVSTPQNKPVRDLSSHSFLSSRSRRGNVPKKGGLFQTESSERITGQQRTWDSDPPCRNPSPCPSQQVSSGRLQYTSTHSLLSKATCIHTPYCGQSTCWLQWELNQCSPHLKTSALTTEPQPHNPACGWDSVLPVIKALRFSWKH